MITADSVFSDQATDRAFASRGYVVQPFIEAAQIDALERLHAELFPDPAADFSATILNDSSECRSRVSNGIQAIVGQSLKKLAPRHKLAVATFVTKRAHTTRGRLPLHQDWWIVDNRIHRALHVWCPLVGVGPESGCLKVVPGIHRILNDPYPIHGKFRTAYHPRLTMIDAEFARGVAMPAGTALVYDERMLHGSDENRSDHVRVAFNCIMIPEDVSPRLYQWDQNVPDRLQVLEVNDAYLCSFRFGVPLEPPYPAGVRLIDTIDAAIHPLIDQDFVALRDLQGLSPARTRARGDEYEHAALAPRSSTTKPGSTGRPDDNRSHQ